MKNICLNGLNEQAAPTELNHWLTYNYYNQFAPMEQGTIALEKEIDVLVYKLYSLSRTCFGKLTYDEVKIIDKSFWLSAEEYEKIKN